MEMPIEVYRGDPGPARLHPELPEQRASADAWRSDSSLGCLTPPCLVYSCYVEVKPSQ